MNTQTGEVHIRMEVKSGLGKTDRKTLHLQVYLRIMKERNSMKGACFR